MRVSIAVLPLVVSCANTPPAEPPVIELPHAAPSATAVTAAAPAPSASASAASDEPPPAPPAMLARLTADQRTELAVLAALCQPAVAERDGKVITGCTECASQSKPASDPAPRLVAESAIIVPQAHVRGAFTAPGADEHLVTMNSCTCNGCLDDAYVVRDKGAGAFAVHRIAHARATYDCKVVRRRGQVDRALCERMMARMGYAAKTLELLDFSGIPEGKPPELTPLFEFTAVDNLAMSCAPGAHFVRRSLSRWSVPDVDRDGQEDLVLDVDVGDGVVNKDVLAACAQDDESGPAKGRLPPTRTLRLTWTAVANGFKPTAPTAAHLKRLEAARKKAEP